MKEPSISGVCTAAPEATPTLGNVMVAMRDGVRLATDVYLPDGYRIGIDAPLPIVLERTPYGKREVSRSEVHQGCPPAKRADIARYFAARGYAVVMQDCRGRYDSEGVFTKYVSEGEDGFDAMVWMARQPWSNGKIGTMGLSYAAHTQLAAACLNPPGLACMVMDSGGFSNGYHCGIRQGGAFELKQATWAFNRAHTSGPALRSPVVAAALNAQDLREWFGRMPWRPGHSPLAAVPEYEAYLFEQWTKDAFDDYWKQSGIYAQGYYDTMTRVPTVMMSSWYDAYVRSTLDNFAALSDTPAAPAYLIMGPWLHGDRNTPFSGDVDFGPSAMIEGQIDSDWLAFRARWFDRWLKDAPNGVENDPRVRYFLMGANRWESAPEWPPPGGRETQVFLGAEGRLDYAQPSGDEPSDRFIYDPADPCPTAGGRLLITDMFPKGPVEQSALSRRPDVLTYTSEPLIDPVTVVGPISAVLYATSSASDTDFVVKLCDVHPDGRTFNVSDGIIRARYRDGRVSAPLHGEIVRYEIELDPTAMQFQCGHRLRVLVTSSDFPRFDRNPNTGELGVAATTFDRAEQEILHDSEHPSHLVLRTFP